MRVTAGPNLRGPMFNQFLYEATVNENSAKFARVVTVEAKDPESDPIRYSIVAGNEDEHFQVVHLWRHSFLSWNYFAFKRFFIHSSFIV